jgi:hypothetical protein
MIGLQSSKGQMNSFKDVLNVLEVTVIEFSKKFEGRSGNFKDLINKNKDMIRSLIKLKDLYIAKLEIWINCQKP